MYIYTNFLPIFDSFFFLSLSLLNMPSLSVFLLLLPWGKRLIEAVSGNEERSIVDAVNEVNKSHTENKFSFGEENVDIAPQERVIIIGILFG